VAALSVLDDGVPSSWFGISIFLFEQLGRALFLRLQGKENIKNQ
jgi:hypothetical protein